MRAHQVKLLKQVKERRQTPEMLGGGARVRVRVGVGVRVRVRVRVKVRVRVRVPPARDDVAIDVHGPPG